MSEQAIVSLAIAIIPVIISGYFSIITNRKSKQVDKQAREIEERIVDRDDFTEIKESYKDLYDTANLNYQALKKEYSKLTTAYDLLSRENAELKEINRIFEERLNIHKQKYQE